MRLLKQIIVFAFSVFISNQAFCQVSDNYKLELDIWPTFVGKYSKISIAKQNDSVFIMFNKNAFTIPQNNVNKNLHEYFIKTENILRTFKCYTLNNYFYDNGKINGTILDGTMTYGTIYLNDTIRHFNFHCGNIDYDTTQIILIDCVFNILFNIYNTALSEGKISFIDYGQLIDIESSVSSMPIRNISELPLHLRFYNRVYDFNFYAIKKMLENIPKGKPVLIETGPYFKIYSVDKFYIFLKTYFKKRKNIYWILSINSTEVLKQLGLKNKYILNSYEEFLLKVKNK